MKNLDYYIEYDLNKPKLKKNKEPKYNLDISLTYRRLGNDLYKVVLMKDSKSLFFYDEKDIQAPKILFTRKYLK